MNFDLFSAINELQDKLLILTTNNYDEILNIILNTEGFPTNSFLITQIFNSVKSIFKINDEKSDLCLKLLLDLFPYVKSRFTNEKIFHFFPFREFKIIIFNLMKLGFISEDYLKRMYPKGSIEYDYYISQKDEDLKFKGVNNNELAISIRTDNLLEFQNILAKSDFNLNSNIQSSSFEKNNFINSRPTLIEYAAFFGSIKIFKFLWLKKVRIPPKLPQFAVAGGNYEIIHIIEDKNIPFDNCLEVAIAFFRTDIIQYLNESLNYEFTMSCLISSIVNYNIKYFVRIIKTINDINELVKYGFGNMASPLHVASENGLLDIVQFLCTFKDIDINITTPNLLFTPLHMAAENGQIDVVKFLCGLKNININCEQCVYFFSFRISI